MVQSPSISAPCQPKKGKNIFYQSRLLTAIRNERHNLIGKERKLLVVTQRVALAVATMLKQRLLYGVLEV